MSVVSKPNDKIVRPTPKVSKKDIVLDIDSPPIISLEPDPEPESEGSKFTPSEEDFVNGIENAKP